MELRRSWEDGDGVRSPPPKANSPPPPSRSASTHSNGARIPPRCALLSVRNVLSAVLYIGFLLVYFVAFPSPPQPLPEIPQSSSFLVTGSAGFIGMHITRRLQKRGLKVIGVDSFTDYYSVGLKQHRAGLIRREGGVVRNETVCDESVMSALLRQHSVTHVVHMASQPGIELSLHDPGLYIRTNVECFTALLQAVVKMEVPAKVVFASSSSVYGDAEPPFRVTQVLRPNNVYGASKMVMEELAGVYSRLYGLQSVGLRFFTVYGPLMRPDMAIYEFAKRMVRNETVTIKGEQTARDFTYVDDVVDGVLQSVKHLEKAGVTHDVFNIGSGRAVTVSKMYTLLRKALGATGGNFGGTVVTQHGRHEMSATLANLVSSEYQLNYHPQVHLEEGLNRFAKWFLKSRNESWDFKHTL